MTSEVTGADVNFKHRSYHCTTLTAQDFKRAGISRLLKEKGREQF
jgi:hypothetical protein